MLTRKFGDLPVNGNAKVRPAIGKLLIIAGCKTKLLNPKSKRWTKQLHQIYSQDQDCQGKVLVVVYTLPLSDIGLLI